MKPTLLVQSSAGNFQAFWKMDNSLSPNQVEKLNKAIAKTHGYDNVFSIANLMRVPGSFTHKNPGERSKVVHHDLALVHDPVSFKGYLNGEYDTDPTGGVEDEGPPPFEARQPADDRSVALAGEVYELFDAGAHRHKYGLVKVLELVKGSPNNKWFPDDQKLWKDINRLFGNWSKRHPEPEDDNRKWLLAPDEIDDFFADLPEKMDFHIDNLSLWYDRPNLIYGKEGCGKSFFVTRIITEYSKQFKTPAMLIASEAQLAHARRLKGYSNDLYPYMANIHELTDSRIEAISKIVKDDGIKLLVIDVMGIFLEDENHSKSWNAFFKQIKTFNDNKELAVVLIHHARKDGEKGNISYRGTSAITGACDLVLALWKDDRNVLHVESQKATWLEKHPTLMYSWITENGTARIKPLSDEKIMMMREATNDLIISVLRGMQVGGRWEKGVSVPALKNELNSYDVKTGKAETLKKKLRQIYELEEVRGGGGAFHTSKETDLFRIKEDKNG